MTQALEALARRMGILPAYHDVRGERVVATPDTQRALLAAMGVPAADEAAAEAALRRLEEAEWSRALPPVLVARAGDAPRVPLTLPAGMDAIEWRIALEDGAQRDGAAELAALELQATGPDGQERRLLPLPPDLPWGYHELQVAAARMRLVVTPGRCWLPPAFADARPLWGIAAQLYLLRSATDWGIGDYGDLRALVELAAARGAGVVGLNPLHALFPDDPEMASPYSPASRLLLNVLNIDIQALPGLPGCRPALDLIASDAFRRRMAASRAAPRLDYAAVAALKLPVLELLFAEAREGPLWQDFRAFQAAMGEAPALHCLFLALREHFAAADPPLPFWLDWPAPFRDPASAEVAEFAARHADRVDFHAWLQFLADTQLGAAAEAAAAHRMPIGLYRDLAVGADAGGAETWANQRAVLRGVAVGAPRDIFNPAGQDWGLPPFHPEGLREEAYRSFVALLRANMRHAGGLRIDHVMGLLRLFCIPAGMSPVRGAYIAQPFEDLVGILALESQRNRCLVVGEDLGTVPAGFRAAMAAANILSYRILAFEQDEASGAFRPPEAYPPLALAVLGSHDLPTLPGWWAGHDIDLKAHHGLLPGAAEIDFQRGLRARDKAELLRALRAAGLLGEDEAPDIPALTRAMHGFLAASRSLLAVAQLDDMLAEAEQVNVPSTSWQHPNWRRRQSLPLEDLPGHPLFEAVSAIFRARRGFAPHD